MACGPALILYLAIWWLLTPLLVLASLVHPRLRVGFAHRWALRLPPVEPGAVVVHAASVGEGRAAEAICEALRREHPDRVLLRTATSDTGIATARGQHLVAALPFDHLAQRWLDRLRPAAIVLVEAELWPGLVLACARRGVPVYLANPRVSGGVRRFRRWAPALYRRCRRAVTDLDLGDPKLDAPPPSCRVDLGEAVIIGASLREGDTQRLLRAWDQLEPAPRLLLAPRHPDRFDRSLLAGRPWCRVGEGDAPILLLDTVGELASFYSQAAVAFIGGGYDAELGGHSAAEARASGVPVVHGPHGTGGIAAAEGQLVGALRAALELGPQPPVRSGAALRIARSLRFATPPERSHRPWLPPLWVVPRRSPQRAGAFVVSVGNLDSGGTGKTPVVGWLAERLDATVVTRGYRGGDEARMLRERGLCVIVDPDRVRAVRRAGTRTTILDDAFQHRRIHRDVDIVCVDGMHPTAGGVIPRGRAREGPDALERADLVWVTRGPVPDTDRPVIVSRLVPTAWLHRGRLLPLDALQGPVHAFAGIARPGRFLESLVALLRVEDFTAFPDHHAYRPADVARLSRGQPLVTTEKDLVRFPGDAWALVMDLRIERGLEDLQAVLGQRLTA